MRPSQKLQLRLPKPMTMKLDLIEHNIEILPTLPVLMFNRTDPHVLAKKTQSVSEGLETILTQPTTGKRASSIARQVEEDEASRIIKLEDLAKLVSSVQPSFKDLDSPKDDPIIVVDDSDEDEEANEVHATTNVKTKDTSVPKSSSTGLQIQELTNQVLILQSQKHKLELKKNKAEAEDALLKAQPSFPNVGQLNEHLDLSSKFNELTKEVKGLKKQVHELEIELPGDLKEIPSKLEDFTKTVTIEMVQAKLKTLDALPSLLNKGTNALNHFAQAIASKKTRDTVFLWQAKLALNLLRGRRTQIKPPSLIHQKAPLNLRGEHIKKDKGKKAMSSKEAEKESTKSDFDDETHVTGSMVETSRIKKAKKFDFVTEDETHIHLTKEQINQQKKIEEEAKAEVTKHESDVSKEELVDLLGP
ncbi:hypothetical protein Tco_0265468 [Tanacetum coccineum]